MISLWFSSVVCSASEHDYPPLRSCLQRLGAPLSYLVLVCSASVVLQHLGTVLLLVLRLSSWQHLAIPLSCISFGYVIPV